MLDLCIFLSWFRLDGIFTGGSNITDEDFSQKQWIWNKKLLNWGFISYKYVAFNFTIYSLMDWSVVDYLEVLWITHSDGTHSLQRIHWWASDGMLNYSKSIQIKKQTHLHLEWPEVSKFSANLDFWVNYSFKIKQVLHALVYLLQNLSFLFWHMFSNNTSHTVTS